MTIRQATIEDVKRIAKVNIDSWRTTYKGIVSDRFLAQLAYEKAELRIREHLTITKNRYYFVADDEKQGIVGFIAGGLNRNPDSEFAGEIYAIYLLKSAQRRGVGRKLVKALAAELQQHGIQSVEVWVLAQNPSRKFYEKLGGQYVDSKLVELGIQVFKEVSYGWKEVEALL